VFLAVNGTNPGNFVGRGEDETLLEVLDGGAEGWGDIAGGVPKGVEGGMESGLAEVGWSEGVEGLGEGLLQRVSKWLHHPWGLEGFLRSFHILVDGAGNGVKHLLSQEGV
jgi:hypothetical protein